MCREFRFEHRAAKRHGGAAGFTLIELMITVAVIAILAAVVLPSYQDSVRKARRVDARNALTAVAQLMERYNTENNTYAGATLGAAATNLYRTTSENGFYTVSFAVGTPPVPANTNTGATTFLIYATPVGAQANDSCKTFTLDQTGFRDVTGSPAPSLTRAQCW